MAKTAQTFARTIEKWVIASEQRIRETPKLSAVVVVADVRVPKSQGGNMPVQYGNLRNSLAASLNGLPPADIKIKERRLVIPEPMVQILAVIDSSNIGDTISIGFTVDYANEQENLNGFIRITAQKWQPIVDTVVKQLGGP